MKNIFLFFILVFVFQVVWTLLEITMNWNMLLKPLYDLSIQLNVHSVSWTLQNMFNIPAYPQHDIIRLNGTSLQIIQTCEGLKQQFLFLFIITLFPGKQIHKLWFIPLGLIEIMIVNILRFISLCITLLYYPGMFVVMHDYVFYFIFYINIFFLWAVWEYNFAKGKIKEESVH